MLFNSITFIVFLFVVFSTYWLPITKSKRHQNIILLVSSYVFYGWWDVRFLSLIILSSAVDFYLGNKIYSAHSQNRKRTFLITSLFINLGILFIFKYYNFFVDSFLYAFNIENPSFLLNVILPVGISFYTFQTLSYSLDIYYEKLQPTKSALSFFTFVSFFPQLVAGPIERASAFLPQIEKPRVFSYPNAVMGGRLILYGLFKKVVISDNVAEIVNILFESNSPYSGWMNTLGVLLFAVQIYCDFSGYSDIAIGTGKLFNINLMTNFKRPYFAFSLKEFWTRWHISLSSWFRDYVYIPLGGSKLGEFYTYRNLFLTFLISGLWHGANWTFVIWGGLHGLFLIIEKYLSNKHFKLPKAVNWLITLLLVLFCWIFFRAENFNHALAYIENIFQFDQSFWTQIQQLVSSNYQISLGHLIIVLVILTVFMLVELIIEQKVLHVIFESSQSLRYTTYLALSLSILLLGAFQNKIDFIYFQF